LQSVPARLGSRAGPVSCKSAYSVGERCREYKNTLRRHSWIDSTIRGHGPLRAQIPFSRDDANVRARTNQPRGARMGSNARYRGNLLLTAVLLVFAGLTGCTSSPSIPPNAAAESIARAPSPARPQAGPQRGLGIAQKMVGTPYHYGGAGPRGFDCSGLVYYSYHKAGIDTPRTTTDQYRRSERVHVSHLQPGDLVFFRISHEKPSHVGIYAGDGRFIHTPSSGGSVGYASLDDAYGQGRLIGTGRFQ
jgi:murein DD-endopeptidase